MASSGALTLCYDARILAEYDEVARRPRFGIDPHGLDALIDHLRHHGEAVAASPLSSRLPDHDDEPFLEVALAGGAICLVTGNRRHFPAKLCHGLKVYSPAEFLQSCRSRRRDADPDGQ